MPIAAAFSACALAGFGARAGQASRLLERDLPVEMIELPRGLEETTWRIARDETTGSAPVGEALAAATATWGQAELDLGYRHGLWLRLSACVAWPERNGAEIDWVQGVQVLVSRFPGRDADWSGGHDARDTRWGFAILAPDGTLEAYVSVRDLAMVPGRASLFAVGLAPMSRRDDVLASTRDTPAWAGCQGWISVQGPEPISPTLQKIVGSPGLNPLLFDPAALLSATNDLRSLGREAALEQLDAFCRVGRHVAENVPADPANAYTADETSLLPIVRLLFLPQLGETRQPPRRSWMVRAEPQAPDFPVSHYPLLVEDGVPFLIPWIGGRTGPPDPPMSLVVDWARAQGRLAETEWIPSDEPLEAAERVHQRIRQNGWDRQGRDGDRLDGDPRWQAWGSVEQTLGVPRPSPKSGCFENVPEDAWRSLRGLARERGLHWDRALQRYTTAR